MPFNFNLQGLAALALLGLANAHMRISSPVPFNLANGDNSPLAKDGSNFPCKSGITGPHAYDMTAMNKIPVNEPVLLEFKGEARHGGGVCQLSISLDKEPNPDSTFKVIQTFYGDCPVATGGGLTFNIPKEFPNVERATLAWTWLNHIGNREFYMECMPIQVTGGSDNMDFFNSLPDIAKVNIPVEECLAAESYDAELPNPGQFVLKSPDFNPKPVSGPKCGSAAAAGNSTASSSQVKNLASYNKPAKDSNQIIPVNGGSAGGAGGGGASSTGGGGDNGQYTQPAATSSAAATSGGNDGLYTQPAATSAQSSTVASSSAAPTSAAPSVGGSSSFQTFTVPASSADIPGYPTLSPTDGQGVTGPSTGAAAPTGSTSSDGSASSGGTTGTCTTDGAIVCNGASQFGLCDHGKVVWQAVAAGTTCSNGSIQKKRSISVHRAAHGVHRRRVL